MNINLLFNLWLLCMFIWFLRLVVEFVFFKTLSAKDQKQLEANEKLVAQGREPVIISSHSVVLASSSYILGLLFFIHSALIGAIVLKEYL